MMISGVEVTRVEVTKMYVSRSSPNPHQRYLMLMLYGFMEYTVNKLEYLEQQSKPSNLLTPYPSFARNTKVWKGVQTYS